jgi:hypothetical protein
VTPNRSFDTDTHATLCAARTQHMRAGQLQRSTAEE